MKNKCVNLYEFQKLKNYELKIKIEKCLGREIPNGYIKKVKSELQRINQKLKSQIIQLNYNSIQASQYVGFIKLKDFSIQIIPKLYREDKSLPNLQYLIVMLKYLNVEGVSLKKIDFGALGKAKGDLFEFLIEIYTKKLKEQIYAGIYRKYINIIEDSEYIRGKLNVDLQIKYNITKPWKFYCEFEEFIENNPINQIFKYTLTLLKKTTRTNSIKKTIDEILVLFLNVDLIKIKLYHFKKIYFTRLNIFYKPLIDFCLLIISQSNIDFQNRTIESFYFLFDMNLLFEKFITEFIKKNQDSLKINEKHNIIEVKDQVQIGLLFKEFNLKPDLIITYKNGEKLSKILLDFKYKILSPSVRHFGISQSDFYQMFAYSQSQKEKFNNIILLYPGKEEIISGFFKHEFDQNHFIKIFIDFINLDRIYEPYTRVFNKFEIINNLNHVFNLEDKQNLK